MLRRALTHPAAPVAVAVLLAGLGALLTPSTADLAAQHFRTELWREHGWVTWNFAWYGGHHVPSYSLTFPPLGAVVGPRAVGVAGAVLGSAAAARIAGPEHRAAAVMFAVALSAGVWIGRMPFTLAVGIAAAAVAWPRFAVPLSALATATSPMAGLFLVLVAVVLCTRIALLTLALPAVAVAGALSLLFPDDGAEWFRAGTFWPAFALALATGAVLPKGVLRTGALVGVVLLAGAFVVDTPVGQNAMRYWTLLAPPALVAAYAQAARPKVVVALAVAWTYLALLPAVRAVVEAHGDPSTRAAFHHELADWLDANADPGDRVEVPMTANHWEAAHLGLRRNIARGWLRQIDRARNPLFYDGTLDATTYVAWLRREHVRWVALPRATPLDRAGAEEARLAPRVLGERAQLRHWTVLELPGVRERHIVDASPVGLLVRGDGPVELPYRHSRWLEGSEETRDGRARVRAEPEEPFRLGR